ncbi:hypothetical protein [Phaffia rhodozyma]|uniref:S-adenosyl-L-methionine-dependent methyltransferase n=1 Tax=Phaffia rhodozyma TaxID=264483 RepID=A0A0F7SRD6_PHARH|nr:hypothetical protein [Phaffia rhodozyma]
MNISFTRVPHIGLAISLAIAVFIGARFYTDKEPYTFDHVELNRVHPDLPPQTEWLNMGYWAETTSFPEACRALALELLKQADLQPHGHHLEVAYGSGDSLLLVLDPASAYPVQDSLSGLTSLASHAQRATDRIDQARSDGLVNAATKVNIVQADAIWRPASTTVQISDSLAHPLNPERSREIYTSISCLDAAYHFENREQFLEQAFNALRPHGTLALADNLAGSSVGSRHTLDFFLWLLSVPKENIIPPAMLANMMRNQGFVNVEITDITHHVFPGFAKFLKARGGGWWVAGSVVGWWADSGLLEFVIVKAKKPVSTV